MASLAEPSPAADSVRSPQAVAKIHAFAAIVLVLAMQAWLVFAKSINWDEFLHLSQVYELHQGRLVHAIQVLHTRVYYWLPLTGADLIDQLRIGRLGMLCFELLTLTAMYGLARQFVSDLAALLACLAYLGGGYVFLHGFAFRPDPMATAMLMSGLYLMATRKLTFAASLMIAILIAVAGMATIKSGFYLPCFVGIAWLRYSQATDRKAVIRACATIGVATPMLFAAGYYLHSRGLAADAPSLAHQPIRDVWSSFFAEGLFPRPQYLLQQVQLAPTLALAIAAAPLAWRHLVSARPVKVALFGLLFPLASLALYRNSFPYYYPFLLAPVAVTTAPVFELIVRRFDHRLVLALLAAVPVPALVHEPRDVVGRQQAVIDEVHRLYPLGTAYLSYSGIVSDYPRIVPFLISGIGFASYKQGGNPTIAAAIEAGRVPVIVADRPNIELALNGQDPLDEFLPQDLQALHANYAHYWGPIWLEGRQVPAGTREAGMAIDRAGRFTLANGPALVDGKLVRDGETVGLDRGQHFVSHEQGVAPVLWRGDHVPPSPPAPLTGDVYAGF